MIGTQLYKGQGFGNQLWVYAVTRSIALNHDYSFGIGGAEFFKGNKFLKLDFGQPFSMNLSQGPHQRVPNGFTSYYAEKKVVHPAYSCDISPFDKALFEIDDGTFIDGNMQSEEYLIMNKTLILDWFKTEGQYFDGCTIHFRGTEYRGLKDVLVPIDYYRNAIRYLRDRYGEIDFRVVTDDYSLAKVYFPNFSIVGRNRLSNSFEQIWKPLKNRVAVGPNQMGIRRDFSYLQHSKYLIIPNSSFSWWAAWTNIAVDEVVAPKYWARHNVSTGFWSTGDILTRDWTWLDRENRFFSYDQCLLEKISNGY